MWRRIEGVPGTSRSPKLHPIETTSETRALGCRQDGGEWCGGVFREVGCKLCPGSGRLGILGPRHPDDSLFVEQRFHAGNGRPRRPAPPPGAGVSLQERLAAQRSCPEGKAGQRLSPRGLALFVAGSGVPPCLPDSSAKSKATVTWWGAITKPS